MNKTNLGDSVAPPIGDRLVGRNISDIAIVSHDGAVKRISDFAGRTAVVILSSTVWDPVARELNAQYERVLERFPEMGASLVEARRKYGDSDDRGDNEDELDVSVITSPSHEASLSKTLGISPAQSALLVIDEAGSIWWAHVFSAGASAKPDDLGDALHSLQEMKSRSHKGITRRQFLAASLASAFILTLSLEPVDKAQADVEKAPASVPRGMPIILNVNGEDHALAVDPRVTLLDALRERLSLTGSKKGCDHGQCGACTVHIDGRRVNSCLTLAVACQGKKVQTIEGMANGETLHPLQRSFIEHDGFQCGYCTSGQIMSAIALLKEPVGPADDDVREAMSGNICRCGAYPNIVDAIQSVRKQGVSNVSL